MKIRLVLGTAALFMLLGIEPPKVEAAVSEGPFRFAVVTPNDHPEYIKVARHRRRGRQYDHRLAMRRKLV